MSTVRVEDESGVRTITLNRPERRNALVPSMQEELIAAFGEAEASGARVATAVPARSAGLAARLIERGIELCGDSPITLGAQAHLEGWYERFGFRRSGAGYVEDGIPHVPMRREPEGTTPR